MTRCFRLECSMARESLDGNGRGARGQSVTGVVTAL